jgi:glutamate-1-semialdehyde 2,1-aminomutase
MQRNLSEKAYKEACKYIPGGVNSPVRALKSVNAAPLFVKSAKGAYIIDIDNNQFIDYCASWGVFILGHAHDKVQQAVIAAISNGTSYGIPNVHETTLAQIICESVPSIEKVRFVSSGTEAVMSAIRLARAYTKRDKIIKFDGCYHGHADHLLVSAGSGVAQLNQASSAGVPDCFVSQTISLPFNDLAALEGAFSLYGCEIAAAIIEPVAANMGLIVADLTFLQRLRELTTQFGSLLIFDEVISGFRLGIGGAQEYFNVTPDLTTLGKIIGGGFPVGAYGGRRDIMSMIAPEGSVYQAGTLSGNPIAMTAGIETLKLITQSGFHAQLHEKSKQFYNDLQSIISGKDLRLQTIGSMFTLFFSNHEIKNFNDVKSCDTASFSRFFNFLLNEGIYISPSQFEANFISIAHTKEILNQTLDVIDKAIKTI